jgi:isoaspartyl peptidase/L-asparaginase-like protein (Ntn-hydrolase superfamily)
MKTLESPQMSRRRFFKSSTALGLGSMVGTTLPQATLNAQSPKPVKPIVISSANGLQGTARAMELIQSGADALDAVSAGVNIVEDDPNDHSVGLGGLPNEDGVVELDASVMHGPTGRVGDSPILGAGLYVDNDIGAAGSTGRDEANLLACSNVLIVEYLRQGKSPEEAFLMACKRIAAQTKMKRLLDDKGRPKFDVTFYAITKHGDYGGAAIWSGAKFAVNTGEKASRLQDAAYLYMRGS